MVSLAQPGSAQKEVLGAPNRPEIERWRGKESVVESGGQQKTRMLMRPKLRTLGSELFFRENHTIQTGFFSV
jgi:hypothetical protein